MTQNIATRRWITRIEGCFYGAERNAGSAIERLDLRRVVDQRSDAEFYNALRIVLAHGQQHRSCHAAMAVASDAILAGLGLDAIEDEHADAAQGDCRSAAEDARLGAGECERFAMNELGDNSSPLRMLPPARLVGEGPEGTAA